MDDLFYDLSGVELIECRYHTILCTITEEVNDRLENHYNWEFFHYWLGDESDFADVYRNSFNDILRIHFNTQLTPGQLELIESKGRNLEEIIGKWLRKWKDEHPDKPNEKMPCSCLKYKIHEYVVYQLKSQDLRAIVGNPC